MTGCVLRVSGTTEQIKDLLSQSQLEPSVIFWQGEPRLPGSSKMAKVSGFNLALSSASAETLEEQMQQASTFIRTHRDALLLIKSLQLNPATIDFGLYLDATEDHPWPSYRLSASFIELAAEFGFGIDVSFYG